MPCAPSPPSAFCQEKVTTSSFGQSSACAKQAEVASQMVRPGNDSDAYAAWRSASLLLAKAQSSQRVSASTSARSTVEPHQMRKPDGASR